VKLQVVTVVGTVAVAAAMVVVADAGTRSQQHCRSGDSFYVDSLAADYRGIQGWSQRHEDALEFLGWPQRLRSVVFMVADGAHSIRRINLGIPPNDEAWTRELVEDLARQRCFIEEADTGRYKLTERGSRMLQAVGELPAEAKRRVQQTVWNGG